jgi:hypothetical protein
MDLESQFRAPDGQDPIVAGLLEQIDQLRVALMSRDIIGQAKGMLRLLARCDEEAAFHVLAEVSQSTNRKLRDVAAVIVDSLANNRDLPTDITVAIRRSLDQHADTDRV